MGTKLYIKTYGCQMNEYDSDKTVDILKEKKGEFVHPSQACVKKDVQFLDEPNQNRTK